MKKNLVKMFVLTSISLLSTSCADFWSIFKRGNGSNSSITNVEKGNGYYKPNHMSFKAIDYDSSFSPSLGKLKVLVIPIQFPSDVGITTTIDNSYIEKQYFGDGEYSLKSYYKRASYGKLNISGTITSPYVCNFSASTVNKYDFGRFSSLLKNAYKFALENTRINFSDYDIDGDGFIDSVHFISNITEQAFDYKISPSGFLWPHMYSLESDPGTSSKPNLNVYLCAPYGMIGGTTSIHEQGHVFGIEDYYNYTSKSKGDYIGGFDMQNLNCGDWNSFSKLSMDWTQPYIVDGTGDEVTLTIKPFATFGDCILIPANYDTYNGSAFDEYLLIELFTKCGNNNLGWDDWTTIASDYGNIGADSLGSGGIRLFHVDARLYGFNEYSESGGVWTINSGSYISNPFDTNYSYCTLPATNSQNNYDYSGVNVIEAKSNKLLTLIQAGKINTFKSGTTRNALKKSDLFQTGDVFQMKSYLSFFNNGKMNNGDNFPYKINFKSVSVNEATITISKL